MNKYSKDSADELRRKIESILKSSNKENGDFSSYDILEIIENINVYHSELEYQNEELKRIQLELIRSKQNYMDLFNLAPIPYVVYNDEGIIKNHNRVFVKWFAHNEEESLIGNQIKTLISPESQDDIYFHIKRVMSQKTLDEVELSMLSSGEKINVNMASNVTSSSAGELLILSAIQDVTDLMDSRERAIKENESKSYFLSNMSHEIRTPMNGIIAISELLMEFEASDNILNLVSIINKSANSLLHILNDILDYSKIESGRYSLKVSPFNLHELIEDVATLFTTSASQKNIQILLSNDIKLDTLVVGDAVRVRQIFTNLIDNAIKFTKKGKIEISISSQSENDKIKIKAMVRDTGIGIPEHKIHKIFERFEQATEVNQSGTGLGLSIIRGLLKLMSGDINVESEPGVGTTFWIDFYLDKISNEETPIKKNKNPLMLPLTSNRPILVADDDETSRFLLKLILEKKGYTVLTASDGKMALDLFKQVNFSMVFLDIQMPHINGFEAIKEMRSSAKYDLPIFVAITAYAMQEEIASILKSGFNHVITKPISLSDFTSNDHK